MQPKSKLIPAQLVRVDAELIQEAMDHLTISKGAVIVFQMVNGICVGIDTEHPETILKLRGPEPRLEPPRLSKPRANRASPQPSRLTPGRPTQEQVFSVIKRAGRVIKAREIGDALRVDRKDVNVRASISYHLQMLMDAGKIEGTMGKTGQRRSGYRYISDTPESKEPPAEATPTRNDITVDGVLKIIQENGPIESKAISDTLNIPRGDGAIRSKVSMVLRGLVADNAIKILPERSPLGQLIYAAVTDAVTE